MTLPLKKYQKEIQQLQESGQSSFIYNPTRWAKLLPEAKELVKEFEQKDVSREDVIQAYTAYYNGKQTVLYPFVLTMIWGFADTGYGTYRTNKYIESEANRLLIQLALDAIQEEQLEKAYKALKQINGLNISYISKVLYFATKSLNHPNYALIFDIRVARALVQLHTTSTLTDILSVAPSDKFKDYERFNQLIHAWAKELDVEADAIELFLFNGEL